MNTFRQLRKIDTEQDILNKIDMLNQNYKNWIDTLQKLNFQPTFDLYSVETDYVENKRNEIISADIYYKIGLENALDPEQFDIDYFKNKKLTNDTLTKNYSNLSVSVKGLSLDINDLNIGETYILDIDYFTFDGSKYEQFFRKDVQEFLKKCSLYLDEPFMPMSGLIRDFISNNMGFSSIYDIKTDRLNTGFYSRSEKGLDNKNLDYFRIIKNEKYNICF